MSDQRLIRTFEKCLNLENALLVPRWCFLIFWTHQSWFCASLWGALWPSPLLQGFLPHFFWDCCPHCWICLCIWEVAKGIVWVDGPLCLGVDKTCMVCSLMCLNSIHCNCYVYWFQVFSYYIKFRLAYIIHII